MGGDHSTDGPGTPAIDRVLETAIEQAAQAIAGPAVAIGRAALGPSANERLRDALIEQGLETGLAAQRSADQISTMVEHMRREEYLRSAAFGHELLRLAEQEHVAVVELEPSAARAVAAAWREMLRAHTDEASPLLAALAIRFRSDPHDHRFRGLARVLSDATAEDIAALRALTWSAARTRAEADGKRIVLVRCRLPESAWQRDDGVAWIVAPLGSAIFGEREYVRTDHGPVVARGGIVRMLQSHGLLEEPLVREDVRLGDVDDTTLDLLLAVLGAPPG